MSRLLDNMNYITKGLKMSEIEEIKQTQKEILSFLKEQNAKNQIEIEYVDRDTAAVMLTCDKQMFAKLENEGLLKRHGRGRFIRYSVREIREMMSGKSLKNF